MRRRRRRNTYKRPDRFTQRAKQEGFAARSVYKLEEIQRRFRLFRRGQRVVDLGCYPGSWSAYVLAQIGDSGTLVGVDLEEPEIAGGTWMTASCFDVEPEQIGEALGGQADVVLSDMAPRTTGDTFGDHVRQVEIARRALELAVALLADGGSFVVKVFDGEEAPDLQREVKAHFAKVKRVRPEAVRKESREFFLVATGFRR